MRTIAIVFLLSVALVVELNAQPRVVGPQTDPAEVRLDGLLQDANQLPPELSIDVTLKALASARVSNAVKRRILDSAFYASFQTKTKVKRRVTVFDGQVLTFRESFISNAHKFDLDTLSLQIRIVSQMLKFDKRRAFELFNEIPKEILPKPLTCRDVLLYDVVNFYILLEKIADESFTLKQIEQGERTMFLSSYVEGMISPSQISSVAKMLISLPLTDEEMLNLAGVFSESLRRVGADDRSFSYEMNFGNLNQSIHELSRKLAARPELVSDIAASYRSFLTRNLRQKRCHDNVDFETRNGRPIDDPASRMPAYIHSVNQTFYKGTPISIEDIKPSEIDTQPFPAEYFSSGRSRQLLSKLRELQSVAAENETEGEIKQSDEWQTAFSSLLQSIEEWEESDSENGIDLFHQKCLILRLLLNEAPSPSLKERIVKVYLKLLSDSRIYKENTPEWFLEFSDLKREIVRLEEKGESERLESLIQNSNNSAIRVYADLDSYLKPATARNEPN